MIVIIIERGDKMTQESIKTFINRLASDEPTPGGGAATAIAASMGTAAIIMACQISNTEQLTANQSETLNLALERLMFSKKRFLDLVSEDEKAFNIVANAYRMPKSTDEEQVSRRQAIEEGLIEAAKPVSRLLEEIRVVVNIVEDILPLIKRIIISDIGVGVHLLQAAAHSSALTITINTRSMRQQEIKQTYNQLKEELTQSIVRDIALILDDINTQLT